VSDRERAGYPGDDRGSERPGAHAPGAGRRSEWRIDELAQRAGVAVDTIRFYQREGLLPPGERFGRTLRFGPAHLEQLLRIRALQARRFSLAAIQALLDHEVPGAVESLLAGREGASYSLDELVVEAGVSVDLVRGLEKVGFLRTPDEVGHVAYDADDVDALRSFARLHRLGAPDHIMVEMARILVDAAESVHRELAGLFHGEIGPDWGNGVREGFQQETAGGSAGVIRDLRVVADYLQHRNIRTM
jgi:DNA-binding transcriptional MerR regulator